MNSALPAIPRRHPVSHKGDYGHVVVVAGSLGMTGAAALAAEAAVRSGAGLVTLLCPEGVWAVLAGRLREVMVRPVGAARAGGWTAAAGAGVEEFIAALRRPGGRGRLVAAVGPGMGREESAGACARELAVGLALPLVLDADGISAFEGRPAELARREHPTVLTPHPGEASRLLSRSKGEFDGRDDDARRKAAAEIAGAAKAVVVLKGHRTVVTDGDRVETNETGNPGMATGGTGDVLTGVIAGLLAVGLAPLEAARLGVYVHGLAGDIAAQNLGELSLAAGDVLGNLPAAFRRLDPEG